MSHREEGQPWQGTVGPEDGGQCTFGVGEYLGDDVVTGRGLLARGQIRESYELGDG